MAIDLSQFDLADLELRLLRHLPAQWGSACLHTDLWVDKDGYPILCVGRHRLRANRVAFHVWCGPIPAGAFVLHRCDDPGCIQPADLYAGSARDNALDRERPERRRVLADRRAERQGQLVLPFTAGSTIGCGADRLGALSLG